MLQVVREDPVALSLLLAFSSDEDFAEWREFLSLDVLRGVLGYNWQKTTSIGLFAPINTASVSDFRSLERLSSVKDIKQMRVFVKLGFNKAYDLSRVRNDLFEILFGP
jgi:hypothetical protein